MAIEVCVVGGTIVEFVGCLGVWVDVFFFFQAEDGIRDLVRSRGLGDVYKRQTPHAAASAHAQCVRSTRRRVQRRALSKKEVSVGLFSRKHDKPENAFAGGVDGAFEVVDAAGNRVRYTPDDFDEIFATADEREMRRHVGIGWLLPDEWVGRPSRIHF